MSVVERALGKMRRASDQQSVGALQAHGRQIGSMSGESAVEATRTGRAVPNRRVLIDRQAVREAGYLPEADHDRQFADQYRQIKRRLIADATAESGRGNWGARLIMMASALPGDGKTFTSINLALSMSRERDSSMVLVDADVAKPHISRIFGVDREPGLLDLLTDGPHDLESLILPTDVSGLSILPAGRHRDNAAELFASSAMEQLVHRIIENDPRRLVLFDSAPLLVSSESRALAHVAGQVVLVVRAMHTPRQAVQDALAQVDQNSSVHLVLNQGSAGITHGYGQGAYGYGSDGESGSSTN